MENPLIYHVLNQRVFYADMFDMKNQRFFHLTGNVYIANLPCVPQLQYVQTSCKSHSGIKQINP